MTDPTPEPIFDGPPPAAIDIDPADITPPPTSRDAAHPGPTYGINQLPGPHPDNWHKFTKTTPTPMRRITGPCTIYTHEGPLDMPTGWHGWLAIDAAGHPYPIDPDIHATTYTEADAPHTCPDCG